MIDGPDQADLDERSIHSDVASTIGPVFTETDVMNLTAKTADDLAVLRAERGILSAITSDGHRVYPAAQFDGSTIVAGLANTLSAVAVGEIDDWTLLLWFAAPDHDYLDGLSPLDWIDCEGDHRPLQTLISVTVARWSA